MSDHTLFKINQGVIEADCLPETRGFLELNLKFFYHYLKPIKEALGEAGSVTFISYENEWTIGCEVEKAELGRISKAHGALAEATARPFDSILEAIKK